MENGKWKIKYFNEIDSTQKYLLENLEENLCVWSDYQTAGIGSRNNSWIGKRGNLFFSFCVGLDEFNFVPMQSLSIYFGYLMKKTLNNFGSRVVLKWPNDLYLENKIGGVLTNIKRQKIVCGIGLNSRYGVEDFELLDIDLKNDTILKEFLMLVEKKISWQKIIEEYRKEFYLTREKFGISAELADDGSLIENSKRIYSKR